MKPPAVPVPAVDDPVTARFLIWVRRSYGVDGAAFLHGVGHQVFVLEDLAFADQLLLGGWHIYDG